MSETARIGSGKCPKAPSQGGGVGERYPRALWNAYHRVANATAEPFWKGSYPLKTEFLGSEGGWTGILGSNSGSWEAAG